ncbi:YceD family protein [Uliginosibacterium sp. 31-16]|uniref:YceD family protein n=1 Tax=Uliginosibacterium sp. 31-16 TaxID=3068315 RepID=UPI00273F2F64|nr:YceD family protein [Uliginosibacterium sp. 31-16]MDP5240868.1 YceD family protein [Uliginosibacterium sp. 31-16]
MSHQSRVIPDPFEFARRGDTLSGELDARDLPRLAAALRDTGGEQSVSYELSGFRLDDKSFIEVFASAALIMQCQRCLGEVSCAVDAESRLLLVPRGESMPDEGLESDDFDPVEAGRDFDVLDAVEEELLLALPLAPTHGDCSVPAAKENGDDRSPFALLKSLKTKS